MNTMQTNPAAKKPYSQSNKEAMRNPWFLAFLGILGVFLTVNLVFVVFAVSSSPGLVSDDYYEEGREYEKNVVTRLAARNKLNWETKLEMPKRIIVNLPDTFRFSAVDARGVSIMDADVKFIIYRPSDANADFVQVVTQIAPGLYQTKLSFPLPGIWDINLKVVNGEEVYHQTQRISVKPPTAQRTP